MPCRILVSSTRKPISYINLAKRFLQEHGEVQLSALGIAVAPMVTVAEILKNRRLAVERKISTSLEVLSDDYRCAEVDCMPPYKLDIQQPTSGLYQRWGCNYLGRALHAFSQVICMGWAAHCRGVHLHVRMSE